jgi:hypothetical protein
VNKTDKTIDRDDILLLNQNTLEDLMGNHCAIGANRAALSAKAEAVESTGLRIVYSAAPHLALGKTPR